MRLLSAAPQGKPTARVLPEGYAMRVALALCSVIAFHTSATASSHDGVWATFGVGLGAPPRVAGAAGDRLSAGKCEDHACRLSSRLMLGGGVRRLGIELHIVGAPLEDRGDTMVRERTAVLVGPHVRFIVVRVIGLDLSVRVGASGGVISGNAIEVQSQGCDGPCGSTKYDPPSGSLVSLSAGLTVHWRLRLGGGYLAATADFDASAFRASFPNGAVTGALYSRTFGLAFGNTFDLASR